MSAKCSYLYGIVPADAARSFGPIGIDGREVRVVPHGAIGMVTSPAERIDFSRLPPEQTLRYLAEHQRVLERVMTGAAVIPLKFGTFADDTRQILGILHSGQPVFARALEEYAGKFEWDVVACWADLQTVLSEIATEPVVVSRKAEVSAHGAPTREERIRLGELVRKLLTQRRDQVAAEMVVALRAQWPRIVANPAKDDAMILNVAVLIGRDEEFQFDQFVDQLNRAHADRLAFRCVGPLPPYSFATAEVRTVDADELRAARQLLGLGEAPRPVEIRAAYRHALQEVHPDRNSDADAADRMKALVAAHELLEEYALIHEEIPPADDGWPVIVKIRSLPELRARAGAFRSAPDRSECAELLVAGAR